MTQPIWIKANVLVAIHNNVMAEYGGLRGLRDHSLLESACSAPQNLFHYSDPKPSLFDLAAHYAFSISRNHPFRDGNKRMSVIVCELFLELNHYSLLASDADFFDIALRIASKEISNSELSAWLAQSSFKA